MPPHRAFFRWTLALGVVLLSGGCGGSEAPPATTATPPPAREETPSLRQAAASPAATPPTTPPATPPADAAPAERPPRSSLADLLEGEDLDELFQGAGPGDFGEFQPPAIDDQRLRAFGIRRLSGTHLTLYTDLPAAEAIDELPAVFDRAVPQWCAYFDVDVPRAGAWRMAGYLIQDKRRFEQAGLIPTDLPPFLHGFQRQAELWLYEQPSEYYRRHLLLHEGTHGFMQWALGGAGPPWYMEGIAELMATHKWNGSELKLNHFPDDKEETAYWGRIKVIREETQAGRAKSLEEIMRYDETAHLQVEPYGWCWAAAAFLDNHPVYRQHFRELRAHVRDRGFGFSNRFHNGLQDQWPHLSREWQVFVMNIDYGYDVPREAIQRKPVAELPDDGATATIVADRGWQSTGYRLEAGQTYDFQASGRYQLAQQPQVWWCEPNGVTIRYHRRLPLGILLGTVVDEEQPVSGTTHLATPDVVGLGGRTTMERSGTLYLRINESPAELADNAGQLTLRITKAAGS